MSEHRIGSGRIFPSPVTLDGLESGHEFEPVVFGPVTRDDIARYARASGDDNPIHQDEEYARRSGAPTIFAMGMLGAGYLATALSGWFGGPYHLRRYKVRFTTRMWPGDEVVCRGRVTAVEDGVVSVALGASRRGPGPDGVDVPGEEAAIVGEAEMELAV